MTFFARSVAPGAMSLNWGQPGELIQTSMSRCVVCWLPDTIFFKSSSFASSWCINIKFLINCRINRLLAKSVLVS